MPEVKEYHMYVAVLRCAAQIASLLSGLSFGCISHCRVVLRRLEKLLTTPQQAGV
jgi:hypothetical protein